MSAYGYKQTWERRAAMSVVTPTSDIGDAMANVCF